MRIYLIYSFKCKFQFNCGLISGLHTVNLNPLEYCIEGLNKNQGNFLHDLFLLIIIKK